MNGQIKELTDLEDFKKVYKVFSGPPYNEKYTEEELEEIFREYQEKGYMYGVYNKEECVGMIALERGVKENQPVDFLEEKVMYLADIAVLNNYRRKGLGNQLMLYGVMQSKALGYGKLYMRTLERGSMSYGIALKIGFKQIPNLFQNVEKERVNGQVETMQNIFLELDLNSLNKDTLKQGIQMVSANRDSEREMD
ncbi:MAG: GNAT family N-acetyltransferase [Clostridia bacterium]|jgi:N-acetylglutamate synthase-like GNAT family acetyltransferase|nr:GNAT family N-acetyltransferase [Clostridia bacterium]